MKIKFIKIGVNEKFIHGENVVNVGDIVDVPKDRANDLVARGKAELVKEAPKKNAKNDSIE